MPAPFAAHAARINRAVADRLANAEMVFATATGSATVAVVFVRDEDSMPNALGGPRNFNLWRASAPASDFMVAAPVVGTAAAITGVNYTVTQVETDPSGWMTLTLRRVA
jgi:hypothetical protein